MILGWIVNAKRSDVMSSIFLVLFGVTSWRVTSNSFKVKVFKEVQGRFANRSMKIDMNEFKTIWGLMLGI